MDNIFQTTKAALAEMHSFDTSSVSSSGTYNFQNQQWNPIDSAYEFPPPGWTVGFESWGIVESSSAYDKWLVGGETKGANTTGKNYSRLTNALGRRISCTQESMSLPDLSNFPDAINISACYAKIYATVDDYYKRETWSPVRYASVSGIYIAADENPPNQVDPEITWEEDFPLTESTNVTELDLTLELIAIDENDEYVYLASSEIFKSDNSSSPSYQMIDITDIAQAILSNRSSYSKFILTLGFISDEIGDKGYFEAEIIATPDYDSGTNTYYRFKGITEQIDDISTSLVDYFVTVDAGEESSADMADVFVSNSPTHNGIWLSNLPPEYNLAANDQIFFVEGVETDVQP